MPCQSTFGKIRLNNHKNKNYKNSIVYYGLLLMSFTSSAQSKGEKMSLLDQAKKEAKRLFNLAKANSAVHSSSNQIIIDNLSEAKKIISLVNGYKSWHEYEEVLKRKDMLFEKVDKNTEYKIKKDIENNQSYYIQDLPFHTITTSYVKTIPLVVEKPHIPIILGRKKYKNLFESKEKKWILNDYPVLITGGTGAGLTETLITIADQYIKNKEGVIYVDAKGDSVLYAKFYASTIEHQRTDDLYCLNLMISSREVFAPEANIKNKEKRGHTIDPINPMKDCPEYFDQFFGRLGIVIYSILNEIHQKNQLMDIESLESILMLSNLIAWQRNQTFTNNEISNYLIELGLSLNEENDEEDFRQALEKHAQISYQGHQVVQQLKEYSEVFKLDCSIDMEKIFLERKILLVLVPALEKSVEELQQVVRLITYQIKHIDDKYKKYRTHFQNIILNEFDYYAYDFKTSDIRTSPNNYIFASQGYNDYNDISQYVLNNVNTTVWMKTYFYTLPNKIKLELVDNLNTFPPLRKIKDKKLSFIENLVHEIKELRECEAYVLNKNYKIIEDETIINNKENYYIEYLRCEYKQFPYPTKIKLTNHITPIIYTK